MRSYPEQDQQPSSPPENVGSAAFRVVEAVKAVKSERVL